MSTIKVRWHVNELANVMDLFDVQKVYRASAADGPWTEITAAMTRVPLVEDVEDYLFDDASGTTASYYAVSYYNSDTAVESARSGSMRAGLAGYATIDEVRAEGYLLADYSDARVAQAVALATALIDRATGQWFEPRRRKVRLDGRGTPELSLDMAVIAVLALTVNDQAVEIERDSAAVYNRHLTQGLTAPDDRENPRIMLGPDADFMRWPRGVQNIYLDGFFGYTDLAPDAAVGETTDGSQVPLSYGVTPAPIRRACVILAGRLLEQVALGGSLAAPSQARILSETTRDQSYTVQGLSSEDASYGITGDVEVDNILAQYVRPMAAGGI